MTQRAPDHAATGAEGLYRRAFFADDFGLCRKRSAGLEARRAGLAARAENGPVAVKDGEIHSFYRDVAAWLRDEAPSFVARVNAGSRQNTVVFVVSWLTGKLRRQAESLRERGWRCFLVVQAHDILTARILDEGFHDVFDGIAIVPRTYFAVFAMVRRLRPAAFHVHCATWYQALARTVNEAKRQAACVCEVEDIFTVYADPSVMADVWPADAVSLEWAMERYLCTRTDGFVHQFSPVVLGELAERHGPLVPAIILRNHPDPRYVGYSRERPSQKDGVTRLVWAGNVWRADEHSPADLIPSSGLLPAMESFLEQGFGCEVYIDPAKSNTPDRQVWAPYYALERFPHFIFAVGVSADRLSARINHCDFGLLLMRLDHTKLRVRPQKLRLQFANKFYAYLEAGLPILVNAEYEHMAEIVTKHRIGLAVAGKDIDRLSDRLAAFDYEAARVNVRRFNRDYGMAGRIGDLIALYRRESPPARSDGGLE